VLSPLAARKAEKLGYKNIKVFHAGIPAWKKAGQVMVSNVAGIQDFLKNEQPFILLDLRSKQQVEQGHISGAVVPPAAGLGAMEDVFPSHKGAPIIICNQDGNLSQAKEAYKTIAGWEYKQVSILDGGFQAWEKAGEKVAKGPASSKITYVRKLLPGEIDMEVFKALVMKPTQDTLILDVRMPSEVTAGVFAKAKHIPLDELEQKLSELPKDKNIVIHCATGARAEMAYNVLKNAGLKAAYVRANIEFDPEKKGSYTISD
jgi:rhodanese-related sulfurtransferase